MSDKKSYDCPECGTHFLADKLNCDRNCWNYIGLQEEYKKQEKEITRLREENYRLRIKVAVNYAGSALYSDDGELQDGRAMPFIDFKRDTLDKIEAKIIERFERSQNDYQKL